MTARDLVYGRQGGRWKDKPSKAEVEANRAQLVRCRCACETWLCAPGQVDERCDTCGERMGRVG